MINFISSQNEFEVGFVFDGLRARLFFWRGLVRTCRGPLHERQIQEFRLPSTRNPLNSENSSLLLTSLNPEPQTPYPEP